MDSNNTWKSLGTVICILASSTHTLVPTFASLKILNKKYQILFFFPEISPTRVGVGIGVGK